MDCFLRNAVSLRALKVVVTKEKSLDMTPILSDRMPCASSMREMSLYGVQIDEQPLVDMIKRFTLLATLRLNEVTLREASLDW